MLLILGTCSCILKIKYLLIVITLTLNACGQRGPLVLPETQFEIPDDSKQKNNNE